MLRECRSSFTLCGGFNASIACTFLVGVYPFSSEYITKILWVQKNDLTVLIYNPVPRSLLITSLSKLSGLTGFL